MRPVAKIYFVHDLGDGWYDLVSPDGYPLGSWADARRCWAYCLKRGWAVVFAKDQPQQYRPDFIEAEK